MKKSTVFILLGVVATWVSLNSCQHQPSDYPQPTQTDTTENDNACDTTNVTFSGVVSKIIKDNCTACHSGPTPQGGIVTKEYSDIKKLADNSSLLGVIEHQSGYVPMPLGTEQLDSCLVKQIKIWVADGAPQN